MRAFRVRVRWAEKRAVFVDLNRPALVDEVDDRVGSGRQGRRVVEVPQSRCRKPEGVVERRIVIEPSAG